MNQQPSVPTAPPPGAVSDEAANGLHLLDYLAVVLQRWPVALGIFLFVSILSVLFIWTRTPRYTATSRLLVERQAVNLTSMQDVFDSGRVNIAQADIMQTQIQLILSAPVMEAVLQTPLLAGNPEFIDAKNPVKKLTKLVKAAPARAGYVLDVSVEHENPVLAAGIVNAVVDAYLENNRARRLGVADGGIAELRRKAAELRQRLDAETAALQSFMASNRMVSFEDAQNIVVDRLKGLNKNLMAAEPLRMQAESRYTTARAILESGVAVETIPGVMENPRVISLKAELSKIEQQYSDQKDRFGPEHQKIKSLVSQMDTLRTQLAMEAANIVAGLRGKYEQALNEENMLREELAKQEEEVLRFNELSARYDMLRRSRDSLQEAYDTIIHRIDELDVSQLSGNGDNVFVISRAEVPQEKSWPVRSKMLLIGFFFGALLAVAFCFFLDYMDTSIKNDADVHAYIGRNVIGGIPAIADEAEDGDGKTDDLFATSHPRSQFAEAFRTIRTALAFTSADAPLTALTVTSVFPSEGKSLVAINLAIAYANIGKRTLLVDTDLRKPRLQHVFSAPSRAGISDLLAAGASLRLKDAIVRTPVDNLSFLPAGTLPPNPVELLDSVRFQQLLGELRQSFDMIIFDAPPALNMVDAIVMAKQTDGLVLVAKAFSTNKFAARQLAQQLDAANIPILGVLLNNVEAPTEGYHSYYYSSYGYHRYYQYETPAAPAAPSRPAPAAQPQQATSFWDRILHRGGKHRARKSQSSSKA
jgi:capsular exopolysaccharide synthesis family protein